ncbi:MAG: YggT family protein [Clostridia bacterium]|nr:YggT family protein [Clostridia bacterium]
MLLYKIIRTVLWLFDVCLLLYVLLSWLKPASNKWTELLKRVVEPVLTPIRRVLVAKLPARWQIFDWSPVVAWLLVELINMLLNNLMSIFW